MTPAAPNAWGDFANQRWELFNTEADPSECHDLAEEQPEKLQELIALWWAEAGKYGALPLESRDAIGILLAPRPQLSKPRDRYIYYPDCAEVPESVTPNIRNRSYAIAVEVDDRHRRRPSGVLFSQGSRFGGHALYLKDGKLKYVYNWVGEFEQIVESTKPIPTGDVRPVGLLREGGRRDADRGHAHASTSTTRRSARRRSRPSRASSRSPAKGSTSARTGAEPVTDDYPGDVALGVRRRDDPPGDRRRRGEPWVDLETELAGAFARD